MAARLQAPLQVHIGMVNGTLRTRRIRLGAAMGWVVYNDNDTTTQLHNYKVNYKLTLMCSTLYSMYIRCLPC